jgi:hypothetical protein
MIAKSLIFDTIGRTLLEIQDFEYLILGLAALMDKKRLSEKHKKKFKNLNLNILLSNNPKDLPKKRQTLGQIFGVIKDDFFITWNDDLDDFLGNRNMFVHRFSKEFLPNKSDYEVLIFLSDFRNEIKRWSNAFNGLNSLIMKYLWEIEMPKQDFPGRRKITQSELQKIVDLQKYEPYFFQEFKIKEEARIKLEKK